MNDCTLIKHARLYKRYLETKRWYRCLSPYLSWKFFIEKACNGEYTFDSARKIINRIHGDKEYRRMIEAVLRRKERRDKNGNTFDG